MLLFHDSFDNYSTINDLYSNWDTINGAGSVWTYQSAAGVLGGGAAQGIADDTSMTRVFRDQVGADEKTIRFAGWFLCPAVAGDQIAWLRDREASVYHRLSTTGSGTLYLYRSASSNHAGVTGFGGSTNICDNNYHFIEVEIHAASSGGSMKAWVDGTLEINQTGINTEWSGLAIQRFSQIVLYAPNSNGTWDDVFVWDDNTGDNFTGEINKAVASGLRYIRPLRPNVAGSNSDFTVTGAASNYEAVDDVGVHDGLTSYVEGDISGEKDFYGVENLPGGVTAVDAVIVTSVVQTDTGSATQTRLNLKSGATEENGPAESIGSDVWTMKRACFGHDPDTSTDWTLAGVNGIEVGIEVI